MVVEPSLLGGFCLPEAPAGQTVAAAVEKHLWLGRHALLLRGSLQGQSRSTA